MIKFQSKGNYLLKQFVPFKSLLASNLEKSIRNATLYTLFFSILVVQCECPNVEVF